MKDTFVRIYQNTQIDQEVPEFFRVEYANPKLFVKPKATINAVVTNRDNIRKAYEKLDIPVYESFDAVIGKKDVAQEPVQEPEDSVDDVVEQKETDHLTNDDIRSQPFFTQKKMVKEKYGVACKNKEDVEAVLKENK